MDTINRQKKSVSPNKFQEVKTDIEKKILIGEYKPGERVPPIRRIAKDYDIGLSTAQKVLNALYEEEIIDSKRGVGFFVNPYIKDKLIVERKRALEKTIAQVIEEARVLNIDISTIISKYQELAK